MQEEPKKCMYSKEDYTDEDRKVLCEDCKEKCEYSKQEEPVSEELEDFALQYAGHHAPYDDCMQEVVDAVKAGVQWQKQQDKQPINDDLEEAAKNHAAERYRTTRDRELAEKCKWSFKAGAQWKEKKDKQPISDEQK